MATGADERLPGREYTRALEPARVDRVSDRELGVILLGDATHGGHAGVQRPVRSGPHVKGQRVRTQPADHVAARPGQGEREMSVHVDQARHDERAAHVQAGAA